MKILSVPQLLDVVGGIAGCSLLKIHLCVHHLLVDVMVEGSIGFLNLRVAPDSRLSKVSEERLLCRFASQSEF